MAIPIPDETILGILAAKPQHGYELLARFQSPRELGLVWTMSTSQLYAVLKRLETNGLIRGRDIETGEAPTRRQFTIRTAGRRQLAAWMHEPKLSSSVRQIRVQFMSKLYISRLLGVPTARLIERQKRACLKQHSKLLAQQKDSLKDMERLVLGFVIGQLDSVIGWLDHCEEKMPEISLS